MVSDTSTSPVEPLTQREEEVLALLAQGKTNREIAAALTIALSTVKWYLRQIYNKLGVGSRDEAVERARALGLLPGITHDDLPPNNLPAQATTLVGREEELAALDELIRGNVRLLTILGPGGIGKTRLALAVAERQLTQREWGEGGEWRPRFADGVWFVPLAAVTSPAQLVPVLADVLEFPLQAEDRRTPAEQMSDYLRGEEMLLVLDNFEQLLAGGEVLSELLEVAPELRLLVTSRERLRLQEEHLFHLEGLVFPDADMAGAAVLDSPAAQLFLQAARRLECDLVPTEDEVVHLGRVCRLVAGMPLALELAASWVNVLPLNEIANEIERNLDFLQTNLRDAPERHQSMLAALTTSWKRLSASEQDLFLKLCIFQGGFRRDAVREVAGATLPLLVTLVNASWLRYEREQDRYQMHELLRQFGASRLQEEPEVEQAVRDRHAAYFCTLLQKRERDWHGEQQKEALREVHQEADNVRAAWAQAAERAEVSWLAAALNSFCTYLEWQGHLDEAKEALQAASTVLRRPGSNDPVDAAAGRLLIRLYVWESRLGRRSGDSLEVRRAALDRAKAVLRAFTKEGTDVRREEAFLTWQLGATVDPQRSLSYFERCRALYLELDDLDRAAMAQLRLGEAKWFLGRNEEAAALLQESLRHHRAVGNRRSVVQTLKILGLVYKHQGLLVEAERVHRESYAQIKELGDRVEVYDLGGVLAYTLSLTGKFQEARRIGVESLRLAERLGHPAGIIHTSDAAGLACAHLGLYHEAAGYLDVAARLARRVGDTVGLAWAYISLGLMTLPGEHKADEALDFLEQAEMLLSRNNDSMWPAAAGLQAHALRRLGRVKQARQKIVHALVCALDTKVYHPVLLALPISALLLLDEGDVEQALEIYALAWRAEHVARSQWYREVAGRELEAAFAAVPAEVANAARKRGERLDLWETAAELVAHWSMPE